MVNRDLVFDVGSHRGEDTEFYLKKGYTVLAFEADPELVAATKARFAEAIASGRLVMIEGAIAPPGAAKTIKFFKNLKLSVWGTIDPERSKLNDGNGAPSIEIEVPVVDFAKILSEYGAPQFVKIDIEGADQFVLKTIFEHDERPPQISWESDKTSLREVEIEIENAFAAGYTDFKLVQQKLIPGSVISSRTLAGEPFSHRFPDGASGAFGEDLGGQWVDKDAVIGQYHAVFDQYRRWGDGSLIRRTLRPRLLNKISEIIRHPLPGWYDTHARRRP